MRVVWGESGVGGLLRRAVSGARLAVGSCLGTLLKYNLLKGSLGAGSGVFMHDIVRGELRVGAALPSDSGSVEAHWIALAGKCN